MSVVAHGKGREASRSRSRVVVKQSLRSGILLVAAINVAVVWWLSQQSGQGASVSTALEKHASDAVVSRTPEAVESVTRAGAQNISSVDYVACCGAGHRMSKTADANYLSLVLNFSLRVLWGFCDTSSTDLRGSETEVFVHLFGVQPDFETLLASRDYVNTDNIFARISNDVAGFSKLIRQEGACDTSCNVEKAAADVAFYGDLRQRFRLHHEVQAFRDQHFKGKAVVGIHIRAGNGESGDFQARGRMIGNLTAWTNNLAVQVIATTRDLSRSSGDVTVFIATDTPSLIDRLRDLLLQTNPLDGSRRATITVVHVDQIRPSEGSGVFFGVQAKTKRDGVDCLRGWESSYMDMMLLSHADVLIAARPSSFTQSLPMSMVLSTDKATRIAPLPYCEVSPDASEMQCYSDFIDWCCRGRTNFSLNGIQRYDYLRMPQDDLKSLDLGSNATRKRFKIKPRPEGGCTPLPTNRKQRCLPYNWSEHVLSRAERSSSSN